MYVIWKIYHIHITLCLSLYIYIYTHTRVCVFVCVCAHKMLVSVVDSFMSVCLSVKHEIVLQ